MRRSGSGVVRPGATDRGGGGRGRGGVYFVFCILYFVFFSGREGLLPSMILAK